MIAGSDPFDRPFVGPIECRADFQIPEPFKENPGELDAPVASGLSDCSIGRSHLLIGSTPIESHVRFQAVLPGC